MAVRQVAGPSPQRIAAAMRQGDKKIPGAIRRGFQRALKPLDEAVDKQAKQAFPSGYAEVFAGSSEVRISLRDAGRRVTVDVRIFAQGKVQRRKITELNRGVLRHPVRGRFRRTRAGLKPNPWVDQAVKPGFADAAVEDTRPGISTAMAGVLDEIEQTLTGA